MSQTCSTCGFVNKATNRFCSNCGASLVPAPGSNDAVQAASDASSSPPSGNTEPVTYLVQTWDAPEPTPVSAPAEEEKVVAPPRPTFVPYGSYSSSPASSMSTSYSSGTSAIPVAPTPVSPNQGANQGDGGMYAPYSPEAARRLEVQKPQRSWLLPSIGAAALLLLVLIVVGGFLLLSPSNNPTGAGAPAGNGQNVPAGSGSDQDTIKAVIKQSNDEQIAAWRNLDTSALANTRTGQVLQENIQAVQDLKSSGMYAIPVNKSLQYGDITVDGNVATAKTVEVWTVTFYSKDNNKVVNSNGPDTLYETYHLVKQNGKWLVSTLDIVQNSTPTAPGAPTPAPGTNNT
jgi:hypothetical protein